MQIRELLLAIVLIFILALVMFSCDNETQKGTDNENLFVSLNEEFVLHEKQCAVIAEEDLVIDITEFYNSPPPDDVWSLWSGVGIGFEYCRAGEVKRGINLVQAFGYQTTVIDTDHDTFACLKITKIV